VNCEDDNLPDYRQFKDVSKHLTKERRFLNTILTSYYTKLRLAQNMDKVLLVAVYIQPLHKEKVLSVNPRRLASTNQFEKALWIEDPAQRIRDIVVRNNEACRLTLILFQPGLTIDSSPTRWRVISKTSLSLQQDDRS
jgi:hypothetical protein